MLFIEIAFTLKDIWSKSTREQLLEVGIGFSPLQHWPTGVPTDA